MSAAVMPMRSVDSALAGWASSTAASANNLDVFGINIPSPASNSRRRCRPADHISKFQANTERVGWVERSETHHRSRLAAMGFAALYPSYLRRYRLFLLQQVAIFCDVARHQLLQ